MTALATAFQARVPAKRQYALTNQNSNSANSVDTTVLELAVTDVTAEFATYAMETFDATNSRHLTLGVSGVIAMLKEWIGQDAEKKELDAWRKRVMDFAKTSSRARVLPITDKTLGPSPDTDAEGNALRPGFDRSRFENDLQEPPARDEVVE